MSNDMPTHKHNMRERCDPVECPAHGANSAFYPPGQELHPDQIRAARAIALSRGPMGDEGPECICTGLAGDGLNGCKAKQHIPEGRGVHFTAHNTLKGDTAPPGETGDAIRLDDGKPRFDLLPPEVLFALSELYARGAKKYAPRSWEAGMSWGRCFGALMRHAWKFWMGEDFDADTGAHHMIAVAWNAFAIYVYFVRKVGTDDRKVSL